MITSRAIGISWTADRPSIGSRSSSTEVDSGLGPKSNAAPAAAGDFNMHAGWLDTDNVDSSAGFGISADFFIMESPWASELGVGYFPELGTSRADLFMTLTTIRS